MSTYDYLPCDRPGHPDCGIAHKQLTLEATMIRGLIRKLKAEGWLPVCVYDGGEYIEGTTEKATLDTIFSVDESTITFGKNIERHGVLIILGNGVDCIPDYGVSRANDGWNEAIERITTELYERHGGE